MKEQQSNAAADSGVHSVLALPLRLTGLVWGCVELRAATSLNTATESSDEPDHSPTRRPPSSSR
ncbi:hypothetical protein ACE14D_01550 [Streptomyces sp. Act-28]